MGPNCEWLRAWQKRLCRRSSPSNSFCILSSLFLKYMRLQRLSFLLCLGDSLVYESSCGAAWSWMVLDVVSLVLLALGALWPCCWLWTERACWSRYVFNACCVAQDVLKHRISRGHRVAVCWWAWSACRNQGHRAVNVAWMSQKPWRLVLRTVNLGIFEKHWHNENE